MKKNRKTQLEKKNKLKFRKPMSVNRNYEKRKLKTVKKPSIPNINFKKNAERRKNF